MVSENQLLPLLDLKLALHANFHRWCLARLGDQGHFRLDVGKAWTSAICFEFSGSVAQALPRFDRALCLQLQDVRLLLQEVGPCLKVHILVSFSAIGIET